MRKLLIAGFLAWVPATMAAQQILGPPPTPAECDAAVASLSSGQRTGYWDIVSACGEAGTNAVASALQNARLDSDSVYLMRLWSVGGSIRHPTIFAASRDVATDNASSIGARTAALMILLAQFDNSFTISWGKSWIELTTVPLGQRCHVGRIEDSGYSQSVSVPATYLTDIAAVADQVAGNASLPAVSRGLAQCIRGVMSYKVPIVQQYGPFIVTYVCGNRFRVQNGGAELMVGYQVEGTSEIRSIAAPANGFVTIFTIATGPLVFTAPGYTGAPIPNGGTTCN